MQQLAKGSRQELAVWLLEKRGYVHFREFCRAQSRYASYTRSWYALYRRLRAAGVPVEMIPGARGGDWTSKMILLEKEAF